MFFFDAIAFVLCR